MVKLAVIALLCAASAAPVQAETFVIGAGAAGREATVKIPVGALTTLSANFAQSVGHDDPQVEGMRLSGDVLIGIAGSRRPIQIRADKLLLELTPDSVGPAKKSRAVAAASRNLAAHGVSETFVGNVVFDLQTASGPVEIKAGRVEHQVRIKTGA